MDKNHIAPPKTRKRGSMELRDSTRDWFGAAMEGSFGGSVERPGKVPIPAVP
jgi:hypothetical protein